LSFLQTKIKTSDIIIVRATIYNDIIFGFSRFSTTRERCKFNVLIHTNDHQMIILYFLVVKPIAYFDNNTMYSEHSAAEIFYTAFGMMPLKLEW
jgi:hypothetical protein